jgi:iron-sulfur cluster assembly protein
MQPDTQLNSASCTAGPGTAPLADIAQVHEGMSVGLTEAAARHITRYLSRRGKGVGVRLGVKTTGCSGLAYKIEFADEVAPEDVIFEKLGVKILVDPKSLPYIDGTELDFVRDGLNEGFKFNNPNERDRCGCGESFRV